MAWTALTLKPPRLTAFGTALISVLLVLLSVLLACSRRRALGCLPGDDLLSDVTRTLPAASVLCREEGYTSLIQSYNTFN